MWLLVLRLKINTNRIQSYETESLYMISVYKLDYFCELVSVFCNSELPCPMLSHQSRSISCLAGRWGSCQSHSATLEDETWHGVCAQPCDVILTISILIAYLLAFAFSLPISNSVCSPYIMLHNWQGESHK